MQRLIPPTNRQAQAGFTIVELMIATMIFAILLTVITMGVLYFSRSYYRGVYISATQSTARDITELVLDGVRFSASVPDLPGSNNFFCVGGNVYVFDASGVYKTGGGGSGGMYVQPQPNGGCSAPTATDPNNASRRQLLSDNMRVTYVSFTQAGGTYSFEIKVAYGDDDLLLLPPTTSPRDVNCKTGKGLEYCAVASYSGIAKKRLN